MRKIFSFLVLALIFIGVWQVNAQANQKVTVKVKEQKTVARNISLKFVEMLEDTRCPADVDCVWAGNAKIKIELSRRGESKTFELNTGTKPQSVIFSGYEIKVVALTPQIRTNVRINTDAYVATFVLTKTRK